MAAGPVPAVATSLGVVGSLDGGKSGAAGAADLGIGGSLGGRAAAPGAAGAGRGGVSGGSAGRGAFLLGAGSPPAGTRQRAGVHRSSSDQRQALLAPPAVRALPGWRSDAAPPGP